MSSPPDDPPLIPPEVAALPVRHHPEHGPLLLNRDVARLLGVGISTLRRRRARGRFPDAVLKEPTASWYRRADIARECRSFLRFRSFPNRRRFPSLRLENKISPCLPQET